MGGQVGRVGHAHMSYYARARVIPDHLVCPIDYPSMPLSISHSMPGFCWRDIGHKALCPISDLEHRGRLVAAVAARHVVGLPT